MEVTPTTLLFGATALTLVCLRPAREGSLSAVKALITITCGPAVTRGSSPAAVTLRQGIPTDPGSLVLMVLGGGGAVRLKHL